MQKYRSSLTTIALAGLMLPQLVAPALAFPWDKRSGPSGTPQGNREDGATRGNCLPAGSELQALIPMEQEMYEIAPGVWIPNQTFVEGDSVSEAPTLWFNLAEALPEQTLSVEIQTDEQQSIYQKDVQLTDQSGLVAVDLPSGSLSNPEGQYRWTAEITVDCTEDPSEPYSETLKVHGWIQRVSEPVISSDAVSMEAATQYAASGAWFDTLNSLIELYQADPENTEVKAAWEQLMAAEELDIPVTAIPQLVNGK